MIRKFMSLLTAMMMMLGVCPAENVPQSIQSLTCLGEIAAKLEDGITIEKIYYTDGFGFSVSEFTTTDPEEIAALWEAVSLIRVDGTVDQSITDWYPQIVFYLSDGTSGGVRFESHWLELAGRDHYALSNDETFWLLTSYLVETHAADKKSAPSAPKSSADVQPLPFEREHLDISNGRYQVQVENMDELDLHPYLTLSLYLRDRYDADQIRNLAPGSTVLVNGTVYTVQDIRELDMGWYEDVQVFEIETLEENWEGIRFEETPDGQFAVYVGDWQPVTCVETVQVNLPLPDGFVYYDYPGGEEPEAGNESDLMEDLRNSTPDFFSPYNTSAVFMDGQMMELHSWSYPWGPEQPDDANGEA